MAYQQAKYVRGTGSKLDRAESSGYNYTQAHTRAGRGDWSHGDQRRTTGRFEFVERRVSAIAPFRRGQ